MKHTPGPWEFTTSGTVQDAKGKSIAYAAGRESMSVAYANGRLIAAAPELLEALEQLGTVLSFVLPSARAEVQRLMKQAEAAIRKAKGE